MLQKICICWPLFFIRFTCSFGISLFCFSPLWCPSSLLQKFNFYMSKNGSFKASRVFSGTRSLSDTYLPVVSFLFKISLFWNMFKYWILIHVFFFPEILSEVGTTTFRGQDFLSDSVKTSCDIENLHVNFSSQSAKTKPNQGQWVERRCRIEVCIRGNSSNSARLTQTI